MPDPNPLFRPNLEALGRKHGYEGRTPDRTHHLDAKYRDAYSDGRAKKQDEKLAKLPAAESPWGSGGSSKSSRSRGPLLGADCFSVVVAVLVLVPVAAAAVWRVIA